MTFLIGLTCVVLLIVFWPYAVYALAIGAVLFVGFWLIVGAIALIAAFFWPILGCAVAFIAVLYFWPLIARGWRRVAR